MAATVCLLFSCFTDNDWWKRKRKTLFQLITSFTHFSHIHGLNSKPVGTSTIKPFQGFARFLTQHDLLSLTLVSKQLQSHISICACIRHVTSLECQVVGNIFKWKRQNVLFKNKFVFNAPSSVQSYNLTLFPQHNNSEEKQTEVKGRCFGAKRKHLEFT